MPSPRLLRFGRLSAALVFTTLAGAALASPPDGQRYTPTDALDLLMAGNVRFSSDLCEHRNAGTSRVHDTAQGQAPFAIVLACADSRVPVERIFDRGIGDVFTVRVAGNTSGAFQAGSIEYAVEHLGSPLLVVLGHSSCGAVKAAASGNEAHGNIGAILAPIAPAIAEARAASPDAQPDALVPLAVRTNVMHSISDLISSSPAIAKAAEQGTLRVVGAVYNLEDGRVEWLGQHPQQSAMISRALQSAADALAHSTRSTEAEAAPAAAGDSGRTSPNKSASKASARTPEKQVDVKHTSKAVDKHAAQAHAEDKGQGGHGDDH